MPSENMYKKVVIGENKNYSFDKGINADPPKKNVIFHNSSVEHITVIATDTNNGNAVEVMIRKDEIPDWVLMENKEKQ
ncbi:MAG: hypothetical protein WCL02_04605 [bacterium]